MPNHELPKLLDELKNQATTEMRKVEKTDDVDADFINPIFRQLLINDKYVFEEMKAIMAMNFVNHLLKTKEKNLLEAVNELFDKIKSNTELLATKSDTNHIHQQYLEKTIDIAGTGDLYSRAQVDALIRQLQEKGLTQEQVQSMITAAVILQKLKTVDGTGSGLDADLLDGLHARDFLRNNGKAMDSHKLEGHPSAYFATAAQLQEVFRSVVDGKQSHINEIDKILGSSSGLTTTSTWEDIKYFWKNKVIDAKSNKLPKLVRSVIFSAGVSYSAGPVPENNLQIDQIEKWGFNLKKHSEIDPIKIPRKFGEKLVLYEGSSDVVVLVPKSASSLDINSVFIHKNQEEFDVSAYYGYKTDNDTNHQWSILMETLTKSEQRILGHARDRIYGLRSFVSDTNRAIIFVNNRKGTTMKICAVNDHYSGAGEIAYDNNSKIIMYECNL